MRFVVDFLRGGCAGGGMKPETKKAIEARACLYFFLTAFFAFPLAGLFIKSDEHAFMLAVAVAVGLTESYFAGRRAKNVASESQAHHHDAPY